jgi:hypothetical protein
LTYISEKSADFDAAFANLGESDVRFWGVLCQKHGKRAVLIAFLDEFGLKHALRAIWSAGGR